MSHLSLRLHLRRLRRAHVAEVVGERAAARPASRLASGLARDHSLQALEGALHAALWDPVLLLDCAHRARELKGGDRALVPLVRVVDRGVVELVLVATIQPLVDRNLLAPARLIERATAGICCCLALQTLSVQVIDEVAARPHHPGGWVLDLAIPGSQVTRQRLRGNILGAVPGSLRHLAQLAVVRDGALDLSAKRD